ncbi:hypothetical protein LXG23DRAFT_38921 [Yarrowia lipolytica]|nr:hypothetical protein BKA91DRAFT_167620 [Yarrowia lipolytica]KAE8173255.1 hypothetical protein BKA90DRAFT_156709 [Yarrowia lipolytica]KAJ8052886.1 hypothetical protein LXG23DRAFT_38921 [Yarrowia lipolytica]
MTSLSEFIPNMTAEYDSDDLNTSDEDGHRIQLSFVYVSGDGKSRTLLFRAVPPGITFIKLMQLLPEDVRSLRFMYSVDGRSIRNTKKTIATLGLQDGGVIEAVERGNGG